MAKNKDDTPMNIRFAGTVPPNQVNGLRAIFESLNTNPGQRRLAVVEFDAMRVTTETDDGSQSPVIRWRQVEPALTDERQTQLEELMSDMFGERTGQMTLDGAERSQSADA